MKIPDILIGKDALPFIELYMLQWVGVSVIMPSHLRDIHAFLSSPFKPELIPELFSGWANQNEPDEFFHHWHSETLMSISANYQESSMEIGKTDKSGYWDKSLGEFYPLPKTLNDFLTDCQRAGITLTYK